MTSKAQSLQRRTPRQARSRAAVEAIVEAAAQIVERSGPDALTTQAVAERAGVSIGTLYQYFADKQAILVAAARRELGGDRLAPRAAALARALIAALERVAGAGETPAARAEPRPAKLARRAQSTDVKRVVGEALERLRRLLDPPVPALRPIPIRRRRL